MTPRLVPALVLAICVALLVPASASAGPANTAALQVALRAIHLYHGAVDGVAGPGTHAAVRRLQRRKHLAVDGIAGPQTRRALGRRGRPAFGTRTMHRGVRGWDVAALQYLLGRRGFPAGGIDGGYGSATAAAVRRFQSSRGLGVDGIAGPATQHAVRHSWIRPIQHVNVPTSAVRFLWPLRAPLGDGFGYPGGRKHTGIDILAHAGQRIGAAGRGTVVFAGWNSGGYGNLVVVQHRLGYQTWYAHMSRVAARNGQAVVGGSLLGYVGATGHATGPHLHFEVRYKGVPINPIPYMLNSYAARASGTRAHAARKHRSSRKLECPRGATGDGGGKQPRTAQLAGCPR